MAIFRFFGCSGQKCPVFGWKNCQNLLKFWIYRSSFVNILIFVYSGQNCTVFLVKFSQILVNIVRNLSKFGLKGQFLSKCCFLRFKLVEISIFLLFRSKISIFYVKKLSKFDFSGQNFGYKANLVNIKVFLATIFQFLVTEVDHW